MGERPILFSGEMVRGILAGRKEATHGGPFAGYRLYCARWPASRESRREHVTTLAVASLFGGAPWQGRL